MKPSVLAFGLLTAVLTTGCASVAPSVSDRSEIHQPDAMPPSATDPSGSHPLNEESTSMHSEASHRATVVTDAGRIDAAVNDDELEMDVSTEAGWHFTVERDDGRARVVWTSGERSVVVELQGTSSGISHRVVSRS